MLRSLRMPVLFCLLACPGLASAWDRGETADNAETTQTDQLQGTWVVVGVQVEGKKTKLFNADEETLSFERGKLTHKVGFTTHTSSYRTDANKPRKELDMTAPKFDDPKVMKTTKAIYRIDGDTLKIAYSLTYLGRDRLTAFEGPDVYLVILKRKK
jgi:uncharacterized protein (TIGR03067 family)